MIKTIFKMTLLLLLVATLSGCGGYHSRKYDGPELDKSQVSIITTDDQFVGIGGLDGKKTIEMTNPSDLLNVALWGRYPRTITVLPGDHKILPCMGKQCGGNWIDIKTEPGQSYLIKHELEKDTNRYRIWIDKQEEPERTVHQKILGH
ncbi:MAG: hypothetical protein FIA91_06790 [Geobacter sp.]|nr:hypothetical protein [Geobacter sp.]